MENTIIAREHSFTNKGLKTDAEETPDTAEDTPKEFTVAVEHAPNECLAYKYYTAEELLDLLRTANEDGLILHVYRGI